MYKARTAPPFAPTGLVIPRVTDDTEEAPWMVMGASQFWAAHYLAAALDNYRQRHYLPWGVASMLPILYRRPGEDRTRQVAPDVFVVVPVSPDWGTYTRDSYDLEVEGVFPAFVLEILSKESARRDRIQKRRLYEALGAQEYALFAPRGRQQVPALQGYRRGAGGRFEPWRPDAQGRLWSDVLALWLVAEEGLPRAVDAAGQPLLTLAESEAARQQAEEELARLRAARPGGPRRLALPPHRRHEAASRAAARPRGRRGRRTGVR